MFAIESWHRSCYEYHSTQSQVLVFSLAKVLFLNKEQQRTCEVILYGIYTYPSPNQNQTMLFRSNIQSQNGKTALFKMSMTHLHFA